MREMWVMSVDFCNYFYTDVNNVYKDKVVVQKCRSVSRCALICLK